MVPQWNLIPLADMNAEAYDQHGDADADTHFRCVRSGDLRGEESRKQGIAETQD